MRRNRLIAVISSLISLKTSHMFGLLFVTIRLAHTPIKTRWIGRATLQIISEPHQKTSHQLNVFGFVRGNFIFLVMARKRKLTNSSLFIPKDATASSLMMNLNMIQTRRWMSTGLSRLILYHPSFMANHLELISQQPKISKLKSMSLDYKLLNTEFLRHL